MWVVMRGRERVDNIFFFFLPPSIWFFLREIRKEVYVGVVMGKN